MKKRFFDLGFIVIGTIIFSIGVNLFLQPMNIYSGGFLGLSQLIRDLGVFLFNLELHFDISGYINIVLNAYLVVFAYRSVSKEFAIKTCITVALQGVILSLIPINANPLVSDAFIGLCIGSFLVAIGTVLVFTGGGSGAGLDIIGIYLNQKNTVSISRVYLMFNSIIYIICLIAYDVQASLYSLIHAILLSILMERLHQSNIEIQVTIISDNPYLGQTLMDEMKRGVTIIQGVGAYTGAVKTVYIMVMTKDLLQKLKQMVNSHKGSHFIIVSKNIEVSGAFEKKLV